MGTRASRIEQPKLFKGLIDRLLWLGRRRSWLMAASTGVALVAVACGGASDVLDASTPEPPISTQSPEPTAVMSDATHPADSGIGDNVVIRSEDAANLDFTTFQHGDFSLDDIAGKAVVINFWFPSCPPCRAELPDIQASHQAHQGEDVQFIGVQLIGLDSAKEGDEFLQELGVTYPNGSDASSSIIREFKVTGFPTTVFLDRSHEVSKKWTGILDSGRLEDEIAAALIR